MFTIVIFCDNIAEHVEDTLNSLVSDVDYIEQIYLISDTNSRPEFNASEMLRTRITSYVGKLSDYYSDIINQTSSSYYMFIHAGVRFFDSALSKAMDKASIEEYQPYKELLQFEVENSMRVLNFNNLKQDYIDFSFMPQYIPTSLDYVAISRSIICSCDYNFMETSWDCCYLFLLGMLDRIQGLILLQDSYITNLPPQAHDTISFTLAQNKEWYIPAIEQLYIPFVQNISAKGTLSKMVQYGLFASIRFRFLQNLNTKDRHIFAAKEERDYFYDCCRYIFQYIEDCILTNAGGYKRYAMTNPLRIHFLKIKYGSDLHQEYILDNASGQYAISYHGILLEKITSQRMRIDTMNFTSKAIILELSFAQMIQDADYEIKARLQTMELPMKEMVRYNQTEYFGEPVFQRRNFQLEIPFEILSDNNKLYFSISIFDRTYTLAMETLRFGSRISSSVPYSYCRNHGYMIYFGGSKKSIIITKYSRLDFVKRELKLLKTIFSQSKRVFVYRVIYWLTHPFMKNKNIWLTFDKMYKAGDNGEYFYRYMLQNKDGIVPRYIINKGYPDAVRMKREHLKPLYYGSIRQIMNFLNSKVIAATHANIPVFSGIKPAGFQYVQDLLNADIVCIQHGLAVQWLAHNLNAQYDNLKRFYCASPYEVQNLSHPLYGYYDQNNLRLTGVARYDGLISKPIRQILIIPTWRAYISMPVSIGNVRPYSETFKETDYFKIYNSLINNTQLIETAKRCNYNIIYVLHPTISSQIGDFTPGENVQVLSPVNINYETVLTESDLMVTDYSGVQFDFAYMRKPILYYHPDKLPPHYEEGGFYYDTMGFGEICKEEKQLVSSLCNYMEHDCKVTPFYKERADQFFAFSDECNSKRIYEDILEMQREKQQNE